MSIITEHECIENDKGELALLLGPLDEEITATPTFFVIRSEAKAYLSLGDKNPHEIIGLNPDILDRLCAAKQLMVVELKDQDVVRTYDATVGVFEEKPALEQRA